MEQTVGEIIDALSKFDRNTRVLNGNEIEFKYNGEKCRLTIRKLEGDLDDTKISKLRSELEGIRGTVEMIALDAENAVSSLRDLDSELKELQ